MSFFLPLFGVYFSTLIFCICIRIFFYISSFRKNMHSVFSSELLFSLISDVLPLTGVDNCLSCFQPVRGFLLSLLVYDYCLFPFPKKICLDRNAEFEPVIKQWELYQCADFIFFIFVSGFVQHLGTQVDVHAQPFSLQTACNLLVFPSLSFRKIFSQKSNHR